MQFSDMQVEPVKLPESAKPPKTTAEPDMLIVNIRKDGTLTLNGRVYFDGSVPRTPAEERDAFTRLERLFAVRYANPRYRLDPRDPKSPAKYPILVRADRSTNFEHLQRVLMMASRYGGVEKVMFATSDLAQK
jgi:biopolymer transport protein ExbD